MKRVDATTSRAPHDIQNMSPILQLIVLILSFIATDLWNIGTASGAVVAEDLCTDPKPLSDSNATRLLNQLLDNYDNRQRPNITGE